MILISAQNSRPAVASEIKPGDLWITTAEMDSNRDGMAHGRRCEKNDLHARNGMAVVRYNHEHRAMKLDKPVRIWTGGPHNRTDSGCEVLDELLKF